MFLKVEDRLIMSVHKPDEMYHTLVTVYDYRKIEKVKIYAEY
jgi:hypothetical protein